MAIPQKLPCLVERIINHGDQVYTVILRPERPVPKFRPGQFLHLALDAYDASGFWPDSRVFSIASSPLQRDRLRITYSVRGRFTARMEAELAEENQVWIKLPYGEFIIDPGADVVLIAGGTGITAFSAFLEEMGPEVKNAVYLAYGARSRALLIDRDTIWNRARNASSFKVVFFVERNGDSRLSTGESDPIHRLGCLSVAALWPIIRSPREAIFYLSGPPAMLRDVSRDLSLLGISAGAIKVDAWE